MDTSDTSRLTNQTPHPRKHQLLCQRAVSACHSIGRSVRDVSVPTMVCVVTFISCLGTPGLADSPAHAEDRPYFELREINGWTVHVSRKALDDHPEETEAALEHMRQQFYQLTRVVPASGVAGLRQVPIWLAAGEDKLGIAFHPQRRWLTGQGYQPPPMRSQIGIMSGKLYLHESLRQPWLIFHELTHGFDWFVLGNSRTYGSDQRNYRRALDEGLYDNALHWNSRMRKPYHATNKMEFFAETSEAFFGTNDIFPFVRAELRDHDPETYKALGATWQVDLAQEEILDRALADLLDEHDWYQSPAATVAAVEGSQRSIKTTNRNVEGWTVTVHGNPNTDAMSTGIRQLERDLHYARRYLPEAAISRLRSVPIHLHMNHDSNRYVAYRQSPSRKEPAQKTEAGQIEIGNVSNYTRYFGRQSSALVKVLSLAWFDLNSLAANQSLADELRRVKDSGELDEVLKFDGNRVAHPGLANPAEFFSEMSTARYGSNGHFPFVKAEVIASFPKTSKLIEKLWSDPKAEEAQR